MSVCGSCSDAGGSNATVTPVLGVQPGDARVKMVLGCSVCATNRETGSGEITAGSVLTLDTATADAVLPRLQPTAMCDMVVGGGMEERGTMRFWIICCARGFVCVWPPGDLRLLILESVEPITEPITSERGQARSYTGPRSYISVKSALS